MSQVNQRTSFIASMCIAGLAIASWKVFVAPMHSSLAVASAQVKNLENRIDVLEEAGVPDAAIVAADLRRLESQNAALSAATQVPEANQVRDRFRELAAESKVRVDRLDRRTRASSSHRDEKTSDPVTREYAAFSMTVRGKFADIAAFIQAIRTEPGINRITAIKVGSQSSDDRGVISAVVDTSHHRLILPTASQATQKKGKKS